ncbi:protein ACCELERATED CELL DEATH 6-like isoform X2 [Pistacia vera]|nr:protein ACCELERATED CELL DEATH 6-like isoform X2 [Pistacia vera]XP_031253011.1 protein ACCELERATED CELL DEATH 6-like isoform X2 [Pistacia vera]
MASSLSRSTDLSEQGMKDITVYQSLYVYEAILQGNLEHVKEICEDPDKHALDARISVNLGTALHVAVGTGKAHHIVKYLLIKMSTDQVAVKNKEGNTVLSVAAIVGNVQAANMILMKEELLHLIEVRNASGWIPLIEAAQHGQKKMIKYLLPFSRGYLKRVSETHFEEEKSGVFFVNLLITAGFYDLALDVLEKYESFATMELYGESPLSRIAAKPLAFSSGRRKELKVWHYLYFSKASIYRKEIRETRMMHHKALQLVKYLCGKIKSSEPDYNRARMLLTPPLLLAAELGVFEVVEEIIKTYPEAIWFINDKNHSVFHLAVLKRQEKVFNLIFQMSSHKHLLLMSQDVDGNNILHLAGKLAPEYQLNRIPGAALQMQHELQWFEEVGKIVKPKYKEDKNPKEETPAMIFTEQHKKLVEDGEKWMKVTANSCSIAAALIATIVFAAAITIPGDYADNGVPNFYREAAFKIFSISDALSLSSSIAAIIMFLSILTARYAEYDFLYSLPKRLIWGLFMLFVSLITLMVAFCAIIFLVFCDQKANWLFGLVVGSALVPVFMYAVSQFPLLWELFISTYRPGIFRKQGKRVLY